MNIPQIILTTSRLYLRQMHFEDIANLQKIFSDPIAMRYYPRTLNKTETKEWIENTLDSYCQNGFGLWICHLHSNNAFVGQCGLVTQYMLRGKEEIEIGYLFRRCYWNQGLATEATKACIEYAQKTLRINRLVSFIHEANQPSLRVAQKSGLLPEKKILYQGNPHIIYSIHF